MSRTFAAAAILLGSLAAAAASEFKEFKDVSVSCTNGLTCSVSLKVEGEPGTLNTLSFQRKAGEGTALDLVVAAQDLDKGSIVSISVDGKAVMSIPVDAMEYNADWYEYKLTGVADPINLLDAMRNGLRAEAKGMKGGETLTASYSLSGLVAALIFADEVQGRLETPDALQARGTKTAPPTRARDIEAIADLPDGVREDFEGEGKCSFLDESSFARAGGFEADIDDRYSLLALPCAEGGAYNQPYVLYAGYDGGDFEQLYLATMGDKGPTVTGFAYNIGWDRKSKVLEAFFKGRGLGDCGSYEKWEMSVRGVGPAFSLVMARVKGDCDGEDGGGIDSWPAVWPIGKP
ncbi:MAG: DUF1176 domain-containing protein [Rhizobiaceae bacterium]